MEAETLNKRPKSPPLSAEQKAELTKWANETISTDSKQCMERCAVGVCSYCKRRTIWSPSAGRVSAPCSGCGIYQIHDFYIVNITETS